MFSGPQVAAQPWQYLCQTLLNKCIDWTSCLQRSKDPEAKQELQLQLSRIEQQIKEEQRRRQQQEVLKEHKVIVRQEFTLHAFGNHVAVQNMAVTAGPSLASVLAWSFRHAVTF